MNAPTKGKSPFYPGQPVPVELFVGRQEEINRITRALSQVELGKPQAVFVTGEYGIGKSSLAGYIRFLAEKEHSLFGIHVFLGGAASLEEVAVKTVEAILQSGAYEGTWLEEARNALSKYVGEQSLFGVKLHLESLRADGPDLSRGYRGLGIIENPCSKSLQPPQVEIRDRATGDEEGERVTLKAKRPSSEPPRRNQGGPRTHHRIQDYGVRGRNPRDEVLDHRHGHPCRKRMKPGGLGTLTLCSQPLKLRKCRSHSSVVARLASHRHLQIGDFISTR